MTWWLAKRVDRRTPHEHNLGACPDWSVVTAGDFQLWHGQSGPVQHVRRADVPGCQLLIVGCCTTSQVELPEIARRLARGDTAALAALDGSRVVIAVRSSDVLVAGDLAGQCPVFYTCGGEVVVSSNAGQLADRVGRSVDRPWLAARMLLPSSSDVWWAGSPWQGAHTVRPGWLLRIGTTGAVTSAQWLDLGRPQADLADGAGALRAALRQSVAYRVNAADMPTADLSGGLDSSAVVALAALDARRPVRAITLIVDCIDDAAAAAHVVDVVPGLVHQQMEIPDAVLPYSELDGIPVVDEPSDYLVATAWMRWWRRCLAEGGSDLHLGGDGGDGVLLAVPSYLADLARPRTIGTLWRHANGWARLRHQSPHALIRAATEVRRTPYRDALNQAADRVNLGGPAPSGWARLVSWLNVGGVSAWATPDARQLVADCLRGHAAEHDSPVVPGQFGIGDATAWLSLNTFARGLRADVALAAECGVSLHSPYLDDGVIRACWSVPASVRTTPDQAKPLLRHAVAGLVPASVVERQTKGDYTALSYRGLRSNVDAIDDIPRPDLSALMRPTAEPCVAPSSVTRPCGGPTPVPTGVLPSQRHFRSYVVVVPRPAADLHLCGMHPV
jgi:asparagine synthase (glutamine-hydrolysing)